MGTQRGPARRADLDQIAETRRQIKELTAAWNQRHGLRRQTPEYARALEDEERLVTRIWRRLRKGDPLDARTSRPGAISMKSRATNLPADRNRCEPRICS